MSSLDLHPDELLDKAAKGTLTEEESLRLSAHMKLCTVCRFEKQVRADFAEEAMAMPAMDLDSLVSRALAGHASNVNDEVPVATPIRRATSRNAAPWIAAAVMLSTMASFAAVQFTDVWPAAKAVLASLLPGEPKFPAPAPSKPISRREEPASTREVAIAEPPVAAVEEPQLQPDVEVPVKIEAPKVERHVQRTVVAEGTREVPPPPVPSLTPDIPARHVANAPELFAAANGFRVQGQRTTAIAAFDELLSRYPNAPEAQLSEAIVGRLLLDDGDAGAALTHFDSYLRSSETGLREEAIEARARALRVLGRDEEESEAWKLLISKYPQSIYKERAESRLNALSSP